MVEDAHAHQLQQLAVEGGTDPRPLVSQTRIFGELRSNAAFVESLRTALTRLDREGLRASLVAAVADDWSQSTSPRT